MTIPQFLAQQISLGFHHIGQVQFHPIPDSQAFTLRHHQDHKKSPDSLQHYHSADDAREISTFAEDQTYRFSKAQTNLRTGWLLTVPNLTELVRALDLFYPAALGLLRAQTQNQLHIEPLRQKLNRQTGMYQYAKNLSDAGAQKLIRQLCGPAHQCAKKILWQLDAHTPLDPSDASTYQGIVTPNLPQHTLPLLCREACNHFVAESRKAAREEFRQAQTKKS